MLALSVRGLAKSFGARALFRDVSFEIGAGEKVALFGPNGCGKSTLLDIISGCIEPDSGSVWRQPGALLGYLPQALQLPGDLTPSDLCHDPAALGRFGIEPAVASMPMSSLSAGQHRRVGLAQVWAARPDLIMLDEPTNHLDSTSRELLYDYLSQIKSTCVVVSHDTTLLDQFDITCELSAKGIKRYGGNYTFYKEQKTLEIEALNENIETEERMLRLARKKIQKEKEKQDKRNSQGEKNKKELPRIARKTALNRGEQTGARLKEVHSQLIHENEERLKKLRNEQQIYAELKIDLSDSNLHKGKLLVKAEQINHSYSGDNLLWIESLDLSLYSGTRCLVKGKNGSGKTTLVNILTGGLCPSHGQISKGDFTYAYLDQEYNLVHKNCTILELAESNNQRNLPMHELRMLLNRSLFTAESLAKNCLELSGGEKMRLSTLMLILRKQAPDLLILDEPTNNIDLASIHILTQTIKSFKGSLLVISHDRDFIEEIGINMEIEL